MLKFIQSVAVGLIATKLLVSHATENPLAASLSGVFIVWLTTLTVVKTIDLLRAIGRLFGRVSANIAVKH